MNHSSSAAAVARPSPWLVPAVLVLFVGSGCAALVYEIVWFQLLQLTIGSTAASLGLLLAVFMGGMCLGGLLWPRWASPRRHPLRVYAALELGIGLLGLAAVYAIPYLRGMYVELVGRGYADLLLRGSLCAVCLLPPTVLMGATLPAVARWVEQTPQGLARLGFFYAGNTLGGVCGCLLAGFYLLRVFDLTTAAYVAGAINLAVALFALVLAGRTSYAAPDAATSAAADEPRRSAWPVYFVIALSGCAALGAEVVWTRLLSLMLGSTTYVFSIILAVFLVGIGLGSTLGAWWCGRSGAGAAGRGPTALAVAQLLAAGAVVWAATAATLVMPHYRHALEAESNPWLLLGADLLWCGAVIVPAAALWGASFPLALAAAAVRRGAASAGDRGRLVGGIYAANTAGAIVGSLAFSLLLLPALGTQQAQQLLVGLTGGGACLALAAQGRGKSAFAALLVAVGLGLAVPQVPFGLLAHGRYEEKMFGKVQELYRGEGQNATIAVSEDKHGVRSFHICGRVEASSNRVDMRTQRMIGVLPAVLHPRPESVLVVGFGAGVTAGSFLSFLETKRIVICEIEPLIPRHVGPLFAEYNLGVAEDPAVEIVYDDARHFVLTTHEKFDIITSDPIHPWLKGAAALYTVEYFQTVKDHLKPGGVVSQWIPLYESNTAAVKSALASFFEVFPNGTVWTNSRYSTFYDLVLIGTVEPGPFDLAAFEARMNRPGSVYVRQLLAEIGMDDVWELAAAYAAPGADLKSWLADAEVNCDRNLRLQYLAGLTPRGDDGAAIHAELLRQRRITPERFSGTDEQRRRLQAAIDAADARPHASAPGEPDDPPSSATVE